MGLTMVLYLKVYRWILTQKFILLLFILFILKLFFYYLIDRYYRFLTTCSCHGEDSNAKILEVRPIISTADGTVVPENTGCHARVYGNHKTKKAFEFIVTGTLTEQPET